MSDSRVTNAESWVYIRSEPGLWTVGFYKPDGEWEPESDHSSTDSAAARVHYLNGGTGEVMWARQIDGSWHACAKGDPGAVEFEAVTP